MNTVRELLLTFLGGLFDSRYVTCSRCCFLRGNLADIGTLSDLSVPYISTVFCSILSAFLHHINEQKLNFHSKS